MEPICVQVDSGVLKCCGLQQYCSIVQRTALSRVVGSELCFALLARKIRSSARGGILSGYSGGIRKDGLNVACSGTYMMVGFTENMFRNCTKRLTGTGYCRISFGCFMRVFFPTGVQLAHINRRAPATCSTTMMYQVRFFFSCFPCAPPPPVRVLHITRGISNLRKKRLRTNPAMIHPCAVVCVYNSSILRGTIHHRKAV